MQRAIDFLRNYSDVAFSTVSNNRPCIRVFQILKTEGHCLYFATSPKKDVYRQLMRDGEVEIMAMQGNVMVRGAGKVCFDIDDKTSKELYDGNETLTRIYKSHIDLVFFRLPLYKIDFVDITTTPPTNLHFDLPEEYSIPKEEEEKLKILIDKCQWTYAKTMPQWPHEYIVKGKCALSKEEFDAFVIAQRKYGNHISWGPYYNQYLHIDGYKYWTMGNPVEFTTVMNRTKDE